MTHTTFVLSETPQILKPGITVSTRGIGDDVILHVLLTGAAKKNNDEIFLMLNITLGILGVDIGLQ